MPRIDRYILSQMTALLGFFALVLVSIYWLNRTVVLFEQLIADGQTALVVLEFTLLTLPRVIAIVLPVAGFVAAAYGTNRMAGESELVVMLAAGLSPWRLARPVLIFGLIIGVMVGALVHGLVPLSRAELSARQDAVSEDIAARFLRAGSFQFPTRGITLFIREITSDGRMKDLLLDDARDPARRVLYTAEEALIVPTDEGPRLIMVSGSSEELRFHAGDDRTAGMDSDATGRLAVTRFSDLTFDLRGMIGGSHKTGSDLRDYSTLRLLLPDRQLLEATDSTAAEAWLSAQQRLAEPLLAPVAAMLGFALLLTGGYSRFGVGRQIGLSVLALIALQFAGTAVSAAATRNPALWPLVYLPSLLGAAAAAGALWYASRRRRAPAAPLHPRMASPPSGPSNAGPSEATS